jgi:hypothetical protein
MAFSQEQLAYMKLLGIKPPVDQQPPAQPAPGQPPGGMTPVYPTGMPPQPATSTSKPAGEVLSVSATSDPNKFIVKTQIPGQDPGVARSQTMTRAQVQAAGGEIPTEGYWAQGITAKRMGGHIYKTEKSEAAAAKQREAELRDIADKMGWDGTTDALSKAVKKNPDSTEFALEAAGGGLTIDEKAALFEAAGVSYDAEKDWLSAHIQVGPSSKPEWVTKLDYDKLNKASPTSADLLKREGTEALRTNIEQYQKITAAQEAAYQAEEKAFREHLSKDDPYLYDIYINKGAAAYNEAVDKREKDLAGINQRFEEKYTEVNGKWVIKSDWEKMPSVYKDMINKEGWDSYETYINEYNDALSAVKDYIGPGVIPGPKQSIIDVSGQVTAEKTEAGTMTTGELDIVRYLLDNNDPKYLKTLGATDDDIKATQIYIAATHSETDYIKEYFKERGWSTDIPWADFTKETSQKENDEYMAHVKEAQDSLYSMVPEKRPSFIVKEIALGMIPVYGTYRYYQRAKEGGISGSEAGQLAASAVFDVMCVVPVVGQLSAAARGTYLAGKAGQYLSAGVRLREIGKAAGAITLAEVKAPFTILAHPLDTLKAGLSPIETLLRGKKIPLSAIETKWNTARIPIAAVGDEKTALKLRDSVTDALIHGKNADVTIGDVNVKLSPAAVNRLGKPVMISATPDIRPYMDGAIIGKGKEVEIIGGNTAIMGKGSDLYVSPTFHSRFAETTSTGMQIKDAVPGGLIIRDEKIIARLTPSGKVYRGTAEIEAKLAAGENIDLGKPSQYLMTRTSYGKKLTLAVYGEPFSAAEIADLKLIGSLDTVKQIFKAPIQVKRLNKVYDELAGLVEDRAELMREVENYRRAGKAAELQRASSSLARVNTDIQSTYKNLEAEYKRNRVAIKTLMYRSTTGIAGYSLDRVSNILRSTRPARRIAAETVRSRAAITTPERVTPIIKRPRIGINPPVRITPLPSSPRMPPSPPDRRIPPSPPEGRIPPKPPPGRTPPKSPVKVPPRVPPATPRPPGVPKPPIFKLKIMTDKEKRKIIAEANGAIAWRQGQIGGKDRWDVIINPYTQQENYMMVLGATPRGASVIKGPGSAYATARLLYGHRLNRAVNVDSGFQDVKLTPISGGKGIKISYSPDTKLQTTGDINISRNRGAFPLRDNSK